MKLPQGFGKSLHNTTNNKEKFLKTMIFLGKKIKTSIINPDHPLMRRTVGSKYEVYTLVPSFKNGKKSKGPSSM